MDDKLDAVLRASASIALLLYLAPAVQRLNIAPAVAVWMRRMAIAMIAFGLVVSAIATVVWLLSGG